MGKADGVLASTESVAKVCEQGTDTWVVVPGYCDGNATTVGKDTVMFEDSKGKTPVTLYK